MRVPAVLVLHVAFHMHSGDIVIVASATCQFSPRDGLFDDVFPHCCLVTLFTRVRCYAVKNTNVANDMIALTYHVFIYRCRWTIGAYGCGTEHGLLFGCLSTYHVTVAALVPAAAADFFPLITIIRSLRACILRFPAPSASYSVFVFSDYSYHPSILPQPFDWLLNTIFVGGMTPDVTT